MASLHLNQLRGSSSLKATAEAIPRQSARAFMGNGSHRQGGPSQSMTDFRTGENFNHLKLTAEKMMQEQAGVKSDLQILKTKLQKSEDQVRTLEYKVQETNSENAMLKVKYKQDMKLWNGLDSKFLSTTTFCDQLAETLKVLDCQVQEAESSKNYLEDKLAERLEFFEHTECQLNDLLEKKMVAEDSVKQCEGSNLKLQTTIREMEQMLQSDSTKFKNLADEKDDLHQQLTKAIRKIEDNEAILRSNRCEIQDLQNESNCKANEATDLLQLNLTLRQGKGELELELKGLQSHVATTLKDNEALQQDLEMFKFKIADLEKVNAAAATNIENLLADKDIFMQKSDKDKIAQGQVVNELKQYLVEHQMDLQVIRKQLQQAITENARLVDVVKEESSKFASLQDEISRLSQECTEKSQLIVCMSQNEDLLRRGNAMMQEQLTAVENGAKSIETKFNLRLESQQKESRKHLEDVSQRCNQMQEQLTASENGAKSLETKFSLQLESQQKESSKHLDNVSQRYNQEIAEFMRKSEKEIEEAIAKETLKGNDAVKAIRQASDEAMAKALEAFDKRWQSLQEGCELRVSNLRGGHEKEKAKIVSIQAEEINKQHEELRRANETVSNLRGGHEKEKAKIVSIHAEEVNKQQEEIRTGNETIRKLRECLEQERTKIASIHSDEIHKEGEELQKAKETIRKLREGLKQEKTKIASIHSDEVHKKEEDLQKAKEAIRKLREGLEQENTKLASIHSDEVHKKEEELQKAKETIRKLRDGHEQEKTKISSIHSDEVHKKEEEIQKAKETIRKLQEGHEQDTKKITCIHADEIHRKEEELQHAKEMILSKLGEVHAEDKTKIAVCHAKEIHKMQEELRTEKETCEGNIAETYRRIEENRKSDHEEMEKFRQKYQSQLQKITEEKSTLHQAMKEMQLTHEGLLIKKAQEQEAQFEKFEKDHQAQIRDVQNSLTRDVNEWRSTALGWEIQLKEALKQITPTKGWKENNHVKIMNDDFKMTVTEGLVCKDIPIPVVTPMTKDKEPQQQNQRLALTIDLDDTTDEDADEEIQKAAPQRKRLTGQSPRPGKRKVDVMSFPEEAPRMHVKMSRRKGALDIHDKKPIQQRKSLTESTKATEDGACSGNQETLMTKDTEPQARQQLLCLPSVDDSRRKIGFSCSQQSNLHPMSGPTHQKGSRSIHEVLGLVLPLEQKKIAAPKRRVRQSTKDVSQKTQFTLKTPPRTPSPAISDLFEMDGLVVPYYKGDDPYAFG